MHFASVRVRMPLSVEESPHCASSSGSSVCSRWSSSCLLSLFIETPFRSYQYARVWCIHHRSRSISPSKSYVDPRYSHLLLGSLRPLEQLYWTRASLSCSVRFSGAFSLFGVLDSGSHYSCYSRFSRASFVVRVLSCDPYREALDISILYDFLCFMPTWGMRLYNIY